MFFILLSLKILTGTGAAAVNPPVLISESSVLASVDRQPVLIYYANETAPNAAELRNYEVLTSWLRESRTIAGEKTADRWAEDIKKFPVIVDRELGALKAKTREISGQRAAVVIATNRSVRSGFVEIFESGRWSKSAVNLRPSDNYLKESNPLAIPENLSVILDIAAKQFDPATHTFLLHIKSHGARTHVISTNVAKRHEDLDKTELLSAFKKADRHYKNSGMLQEVEGEKLGTTKTEFFAILAEKSKTGMKFPLIFLESCRSGVNVTAATDVENVGFLISSDHKGIGYENIDFAAIPNMSNTDLYQAYFEQLRHASKTAHKNEYGMDLSIAEHFLPSRAARMKLWLKSLF